MKNFLIIFVLTFLIAGCLEYHEKMNLNNDGSGKITFAVGISESLFNMGGGHSALQDFSDVKIKETYSNKKGIKFLGSRTYSEEGDRWIEIKLSFESVAALNEANNDSIQHSMLGKITLKQDRNGNMVFERIVANKNPVPESDSSSNSIGNGVMEMMFGQYKWKYELTLPGKIISTNAQESDVGKSTNTVKWTISMASLSHPANLSVTFEKKTEYNLTLIILAMLAVITLGLIFLFRIRKIDSPPPD